MKTKQRSSKPYKDRHFILKVLKWLDLLYIQPKVENQKNGYLLSSERLYLKFSRIVKTRGKKEGIRFCKELRSSIYQWLTTIDSLDKDVRSSSSYGLPKDLRFLKRVETLEYPHLRLLLSALYVSRGVKLPISPNVDSITSGPRYIGKPWNNWDQSFVRFWDTLGYRHRNGDIPNMLRWKKFHLSTKKGPNGQALWTALQDLCSLPPDLFDDICKIGGDKLKLRMLVLKNFSWLLKPFFNTSGNSFRRVTAIADKEGKTREVAILDYWSQTALRGLHNYLFMALKKIPQDCTFNQGSFQEKIKLFPKGHLYHSVDLTTATDRFPIELIQSLLKARFNQDYVNSWRNLMVGHSFECPQLKRNISYAVGNPMGAYSSWNSFALAHHFIVFKCCEDLGLNWRRAPYVLLGDDIVIKHNALAKRYMEVMTDLGVEFSLQKSHISGTVFEFAKRIFHCSSEVTPFPCYALFETRKTPSLMLSILFGEECKGWIPPIGTPEALSELYRILGFNATFVAKKLKDFYITHQIMMCVRRVISAQDCMYNIVVKYFPDSLDNLRKKFQKLPPFIFDQFKMQALELTFMKMFRESLSRSFSSLNKTGKPLGLIAEKLLILITGEDKASSDMFDLIQAIPILQIHGQVEEAYMKVVKGAPNEILVYISKDWKSALRILTIPISDDVYVSRNQDIHVVSSFTFSKILQELLSKEQLDLGPMKVPMPRRSPP